MKKTTRHFILLQNTKQKLVECQCSLKTALDSICVYRKSTSTFLATSHRLEGGGLVPTWGGPLFFMQAQKGGSNNLVHVIKGGGGGGVIIFYAK